MVKKTKQLVHCINFVLYNYDLYRQSLYDNEQQIQDHFAQFWAQVAQRFKDNPYVLGYELLNEPWAGDVYRHPDHFEPSKQTCGTIRIIMQCTAYTFLGVSDPKNLMPMYKKLHSAIREVDDRHVVLFEPTIIITSVSIVHCVAI